MDQHLGRRDIRRDRDVVHVAKAQKVLVVRRFRLLRLHGIAEKQQEVDLIAGDARRNLLVAALFAAQKAVDVEARRVRNELACRAGCAKRMTAQNATISDAELNHQLFFRIVGGQCNVHKIFLPLIFRTSEHSVSS